MPMHLFNSLTRLCLTGWFAAALSKYCITLAGQAQVQADPRPHILYHNLGFSLG